MVSRNGEARFPSEMGKVSLKSFVYICEVTWSYSSPLREAAER
jgi:hypothetical protein